MGRKIIRHQREGVAQRPVFTCFLVIVFVQLALQFLEDSAHGMIVHCGLPDGTGAVEHRVGAQVDIRIKKLVDQRAQRICL